MFFVNENNSSLIQWEQLVHKKIEQLKKSPPGFFAELTDDLIWDRPC